MIQSDNATMQYKNRHAFALLQKLANEFNLRIIRTYGAAGHGKGTIDAMSSFGVKNVLRRDIVTQDIFFDTSEEIVDYLHIRNSQFYYASIDPRQLARKRHDYNEDGESIEIKGCMKQHLFVYKPNSTEVMCSEYLCDCFECLQLNFDNCCSSYQLDDIENTNTEEEFDDQTEIENYREHIFEFVDAPSYMTPFSGRSMEPLYFVVVTEKRVADKLLKDCYDHVINIGEMFFKGNYLKLVRSCNPSTKQFQVIQRKVLLPPGEINDTYVDINKDLQTNINVCNGLINKAQF